MTRSSLKVADGSGSNTEENDVEAQGPLQGVAKTVKEKTVKTLRAFIRSDKQTEEPEVPLTSVETNAPSSSVQPSTA